MKKTIRNSFIFWFVTVFLVMAVTLLIIFGALNTPIKIIKYGWCIITNGEFVLRSDEELVCLNVFQDAGKTCSSKKDCKGFCVQKTRSDGICSEYPLSKSCYKKFSNIPFERSIDARADIELCPPKGYR